MSEAQSVMRPTIFGSLLDIAAHNAARGSGDIAIFESGNVYRRHADPAEPLADEHHALGALLTGAARPATWAEPEPPRADVMTAKALVEAVLGALRVDWEAVQTRRPFLHPGRAGEIRCGEDGARHLRRAAPDRRRHLGLRRAGRRAGDRRRQGDRARRRGASCYADLTSFPELRQDLAVIVPRRRPGRRACSRSCAARARR